VTEHVDRAAVEAAARRTVDDALAFVVDAFDRGDVRARARQIVEAMSPLERTELLLLAAELHRDRIAGE
jgi:hypothetical protein